MVCSDNVTMLDAAHCGLNLLNQTMITLGPGTGPELGPGPADGASRCPSHHRPLVLWLSIRGLVWQMQRVMSPVTRSTRPPVSLDVRECDSVSVCLAPPLLSPNSNSFTLDFICCQASLSVSSILRTLSLIENICSVLYTSSHTLTIL